MLPSTITAFIAAPTSDVPNPYRKVLHAEETVIKNLAGQRFPGGEAEFPECRAAEFTASRNAAKGAAECHVISEFMCVAIARKGMSRSAFHAFGPRSPFSPVHGFRISNFERIVPRSLVQEFQLNFGHSLLPVTNPPKIFLKENK